MGRLRSHSSDNELRIGGIFSLTGYLSWSGRHKRKAAELKVEMINREGGVNGRSLRLIAFDDQSGAENASRIAEDLVFRHRVTALVGTGTLPISKAVARVANRFRVPAFVNSGYAIDPASDLFVFNTAHKTEFAVSCAFQYFLERGIDRLGLLMPYGPLGDLGSWLGRRLAARMGLRVVEEERFDARNGTPILQLRRLRNLKPGALFSFVTGSPAASVAEGMKSAGFAIPLLVSHGNANPRFLKLLSHNPVPIIVPSGWTTAMETIPEDDPSLRIVTEFNDQHLRRYGEPANDYSAESADAIDLLAEGLRLAGDSDNERVRDAVESITGFQGVRGNYHLSPIDHHGTGIEQIVLLTIRNGEWQFTKTFSSPDIFDGFHDAAKGRLVRKVTDLLSPADSDTGGVDNSGERGTLDFLTARTGLNCTELGSDRYFGAKIFCRQKMEMIHAVRERDFARARAALSRLLTVAVLEHAETPEALRLAVLELFLALFDSAIHEGTPIEEIVRTRQNLLLQWETLKDRESLCLWIIKAMEIIKTRLAIGRVAGSDLRERVLKLIEDHLAESLTVEWIAREVGLSPSRLMHIMRSSYNTSVGDCVTKARIEAAKRLLRCGDLTLSAIACAVGYNDHGYFTRVFKKQIGETPQLYRKRTSSSFVQ
jgi:branched-chain amino acid transport system substrate-binding protein